MISFDTFFERIAGSPLQRFAPDFRAAIQQRFHDRLHGDFDTWEQALEELPQLTPDLIRLDGPEITLGNAAQFSLAQQQKMHHLLRLLHPWRKGPWNLFGTQIDAEWRSDAKWARVAPHMQSLRGRLVLDVGCGNGYYAWRMCAEQPQLIIGVDPSHKFFMQFNLFKRYAPDLPVEYLPLRDQDLPPRMGCFDAVLSMGVLYHRKSPFDHLEQLHQCLRPGGELVLETLVIRGGASELLVPRDRYAQMPNVWFIPSPDMLMQWMTRSGFENVRLVDITQTTTREQRSTEWMQFHSLEDYLDPKNPNLTIEGYPAPLRAILLAEKTG